MAGRVLVAVGVVVALIGLVAWQLGFLTPEPEEVSLADAVAGETGDNPDERGDGSGGGDNGDESETTTTTATPTTTTTAAEVNSVAPCTFVRPEPPVEGAATAVADLAGLAGTWTVVESESTFAGYRIDEILSGQDFTAVGRTSGVSGSVIIDEDATITGADIAVDLVGLTSDSRIRDEQLKRQALQTSRFTTACFTLTEPIAVDALPADGAALTVETAGELHIHGVNQPVSITVESTTAEGLLFVVGSTEIALADFAIEKPTAPSVADVSDTAVMEFSLVLARQP